jgi:acid phosphatase type 7
LKHFGHFHCYYRSYPVFDGKPFQTSGNVYRNPKGPVHLMVGAAGAGVGVEAYCGKEFLERPYIAYTDDTNYGFGRMHIFNSTHLKFQFYRIRDSKYTDEMWIVKDE